VCVCVCVCVCVFHHVSLCSNCGDWTLRKLAHASKLVAEDGVESYGSPMRDVGSLVS